MPGSSRTEEELVDPLARLFAAEGDETEVGGNRPLLLDDPGAAWLVMR